MAYIDLRIEFEEEEEDFDPPYTHYEAIRVTPLGSDIPEGGLQAIAEAAFQTDFYTVEVANALLSALDGETVTDLMR